MEFDVITIGTAARDAFLKSKGFKLISFPGFISGQGLCLPAGSKIEVEDVVFSIGGGAANAAVTFARYGYKTAAICKIGSDISGREVIANLQAENINTQLVIQDSNLKTAYSILILADSGERTVLIFRGAAGHLELEETKLPELQAKCFFVSGALPMDLLNGVLDRAQKINARVALNPSSNQIKLGLKGLEKVLKRVDILIVNREEGAYLTGVGYKRAEDIFNLLDKHVDGIVVLTDGAKGVMVSDGQSVYKAGIYKERIVADNTGAGDAFGSGFVASLLSDNDIERAIKFASANATSVIELIGAKTGILTKFDFEHDERWRSFEITKTSLNK